VSAIASRVITAFSLSVARAIGRHRRRWTLIAGLPKNGRPIVVHGSLVSRARLAIYSKGRQWKVSRTVHVHC
jgi:hypothetical protein